MIHSQLTNITSTSTKKRRSGLVDAVPFLLCDHVVCLNCIDSSPELRKPGFDGIRCPCGLTTFFKVSESKSIEGKSYEGSTTRPSVGLIQSRRTLNNKYGSRAQTEYVSLEP